MAELVPGAQTLPIWKDPNATPFIKIKNVTKKFGDFVAVNDVSLTFIEANCSACSAVRAAANRLCCACWRALRSRPAGRSTSMARIRRVLRLTGGPST